MGVREIASKLIKKVSDGLREVDEEQTEAFLRELMGADRVYVHGAGRSGLVGRAFAMRLMHLGFEVYVVGETVTPAMRMGDVLVAISGSGRTSSVVGVAKMAKEKIGAKVVAITSYPDSPLGTIADVVVRIRGRRKDEERSDEYLVDQIVGHSVPIAPLGTLFEVTTLVYLDGVVVELMRRLRKREEELRARHANLE